MSRLFKFGDKTHKRTISGNKIKDLRMASLLGSSAGKGGAKFFDEEELDTTFENFDKILKGTEMDLTSFVENMSYNGFNKQEYGRLFAKAIGAKRLVKVLVLGAMRGTNLAKIISKSVKVDPDIKKMYDRKLIKSNGKDYGDLTVGRALACFPEVACHYLIRHNVPKKILGNPCPASLQFPAAAGIPMTALVRSNHISFSIEFSRLIGSKPEIQYYMAGFNGQCAVESVSELVKEECGNPTDEESRRVDVAAIWNSLLSSRNPAQDGGVPLKQTQRL
jgi:hypothetical protein